MTVDAAAVESPALLKARQVVELAVRACQAYKRNDLEGRLAKAQRALTDPVVHVVIAGEFKQGKSSLVNALLGAPICPVDDDVATAIPTYVRHGAEEHAFLLMDDGDNDKPRREPIGLDQLRPYVVESGRPRLDADRVIGVEIHLPRQLLAAGLVIVDTPGVGGLGSAHAAASLAAIAMADAVIFVTDASQELTRSEVDFVFQARDLCKTVICALTKTDFYPAWRRIKELDEGHLRAVADVPVLPISSSLRTLAVKNNDRAMNAESGFADVVGFVSDRVGSGAAIRIAGNAAAEVLAVTDQIQSTFQAERSALADPAGAQQVVDDLNRAKAKVELLRSAAAKWAQTLQDGIADLNADIDHDLRARIRVITQEGDDAMENADPADAWPQMESWLQSRVSYELLANYGLLRTRADALSEDVFEHFSAASGEILDQLAVFNPVQRMSGARVEHRIELEKMKAGKKAMVMLKSAYGGVLMFTMLSSMAGIALGPIGIGIGLVMGHKGLREEKKRQLTARRNAARNAIRRYCDEVSFVMGKDSRDTLRRIQRQLRDHYSELAEELHRSNTEALNAAAEAVKRTQADRDRRLKDLDAEIARLAQLRQLAQAVTA